MIRISKIDGFLSINEHVASRIKIPHDILNINKPCEILITDRRLIVYDSKWNDKYFAETTLSRISSVQIHAKNRIMYLINAVGLFILGFMLTPLLGTISALSDFLVILPAIIFLAAMTYILAYFVTRSSAIYIYVQQAEPIKIMYMGSTTAAILEQLIVNIDMQRKICISKNESSVNQTSMPKNDGQYRLHK